MIQEVRYFICECDDCGKQHPHEDDDLTNMEEAVTDDGWMINRDRHNRIMSVFCVACFERTLGMPE